jgi:drug/metabolite transporter (DMT)-like permease
LTSNTSKVANLIFLAPFLSLFLIALVLDEAIRASTGVGLVLIVAGLLLQQGGAQAVPAVETAQG